jgi:hypothetical protein
MALTPYWQQQVDPFYGGARTIGEGIARIPMMRSMAAQRAAQSQYQLAHAEQEREAAELERQKAIAAANETQESSDFAEAAATAVPVFSDPSSKQEDRQAAATDLMRKAGRLAAKNPDKAMQIFDHLVQRMQVNPTDLTQQYEVNSGKTLTGSDVLTDEQLAAAQAAKNAPKGTAPINAASTSTIAAGLPAAALKSVSESQPIPGNPATPTPTGYKPFPLTISQALQSKLQNTFVQLVESGVPPAQAEIQAKGLVLGTNATAEPNIVTNSPGSPEIRTPGKIWGTNVTPAVPPTTSTNSYTVQPGGADQTIVGQLSKDPRFSGLLNQLGLAPVTATSPDVPDTGTLAPQTSTATVQPQGIRVRNKKTGQMGTQLPDGTVIPDQAQ